MDKGGAERLGGRVGEVIAKGVCVVVIGKRVRRGERGREGGLGFSMP